MHLLGLKLYHACDQWHSSRESALSYWLNCKLCRAAKGPWEKNRNRVSGGSAAGVDGEDLHTELLEMDVLVDAVYLPTYV